jgi:hypothetical protein
MSKNIKADEYGRASNHGRTIIRARNNFIPEIESLIPRASRSDLTEFVDYMIECGYLTETFFKAWTLDGGDDDE